MNWDVKHKIQSQEGALGLLASGNLLAEIPWDILLEYSDLIVLALTIGIHIRGGESIDVIINIVFLFVLVYIFIPSIFPKDFRPVSRKRGFRLLSSVFVISIVVIIMLSISSPGDEYSQGRAILHGSISIVVSLILFTYYLFLIEEFDLHDPESPAIAYLQFLQITIHDDHVTIHDDHVEWIPEWGKYVSFFPLILFAIFSLMLLGIFIAALEQLSPLLELLVLGWIGYHRISERSIRVKGEYLPTKDVVDIGERVNDAIASILCYDTIKGGIVLLLVSTGTLYSIAFFIIGLQIFIPRWFSRISGTKYLVLIEDMGLRYTFLILLEDLVINSFFTIIPFIISLYSIWFWVRVLERLPYFLDTWVERYKQTSRSLDLPSEEPPARPPDYLVLPMLLMITYALGLDRILFVLILIEPDISKYVYLFITSLIVVLILWSVRRTTRISPQGTSRELRTVIIALTVQLTAFYGFQAYFIRNDLSVFGFGFLAAIALGWLSYTPDRLYSDEASWKTNGYLLFGVPIFGSWIWISESPLVEIASTIVIGTIIGGVILIILVNHFAKRRGWW